MNECCRETYKKVLEEVLYTIKNSKEQVTIEMVIKSLIYAINLLEKTEEEK